MSVSPDGYPGISRGPDDPWQHVAPDIGDPAFETVGGDPLTAPPRLSSDAATARVLRRVGGYDEQCRVADAGHLARLDCEESGSHGAVTASSSFVDPGGAVPSGVGGPDPARPCEGCLKRARCRAPCALLARLVPEEDVPVWNEVSSPALMESRSVDEQFMAMPEALLADEPEHLWPVVVAYYSGARLRAATAVLTQQHVAGQYLDGASRAEIGTGRGTSRQATHKVFWAAIGRLQRELGPLLPRSALAASTVD